MLRDSHVDSKYVTAEDVLPSGLIDGWLHYVCKNGHVGSSESVQLLRRLRKRRFDTLVYLAPRLRTRSQVWRDLLFFRLAGIRRFYGHKGFKKLPDNVRPLPRVQHEADHLLDRLIKSGVETLGAPQAIDLQITGEEEAAAHRWLVDHGVVSKPLIGFGPGSKSPAKRWPVEYFAELGRYLISEFDVEPVLFGGSEDYELSCRLIGEWRRGINAAGRLRVRHAGAVLSKCQLYVGNDTGTMHIAAAVGTPCVAIFSAQDWPGRWHPYGNGHTVLREKVSCEGCQLKECTTEGLRCLTRISPRQVLEACRLKLATVQANALELTCAE